MSAKAETPSPLGQHPDPESERSEPRITLTGEEARAIQRLCVDVWGIMNAALARGARPQAAAQQRAAEEHADVAAPAVPKLPYVGVLGKRTSPEAPEDEEPQAEELQAEKPQAEVPQAEVPQAEDFSGWDAQLSLKEAEETENEETVHEEPQAEVPQAENVKIEPEDEEPQAAVPQAAERQADELQAAEQVPWQPGPNTDALFRDTPEIAELRQTMLAMGRARLESMGYKQDEHGQWQKKLLREIMAEPSLEARQAILKSIGRTHLESMGYKQDDHGQWLTEGSSRHAVAAEHVADLAEKLKKRSAETNK